MVNKERTNMSRKIEVSEETWEKIKDQVEQDGGKEIE